LPLLEIRIEPERETGQSESSMLSEQSTFLNRGSHGSQDIPEEPGCSRRGCTLRTAFCGWE
jgi:hypothetical protein